VYSRRAKRHEITRSDPFGRPIELSVEKVSAGVPNDQKTTGLTLPKTTGLTLPKTMSRFNHGGLLVHVLCFQDVSSRARTTRQVSGEQEDRVGAEQTDTAPDDNVDDAHDKCEKTRKTGKKKYGFSPGVYPPTAKNARRRRAVIAGFVFRLAAIM